MVMKDSEKWKRPATEGYTDSKDAWYWHRTENLVKEEMKKTSTLAHESALVSITASVVTMLITLLIHFWTRKSR